MARFWRGPSWQAPGWAISVSNAATSKCGRHSWPRKCSHRARRSHVSMPPAAKTSRRLVKKRCSPVRKSSRRQYLVATQDADRFGFVAHTLAVRDGCSSNRCATLALLRDPARVRANLSAQTFDRYVDRYLPLWGQPTDTPVAEVAPGSTGMLAAGQPPAGQRKVILDADFPSAASIPAVSIMNPEPKTSPANLAAEARGVPSGHRSSRKAANTPAPVSAPSAATLVPSVEPVWAPGTASIPSSQPSPPPPSLPTPQASAAQTPAAQ